MRGYGGSKILLGSLLLFYAVVYFHRVMTGVMKVEIDSIAELYKVDANVLLALLSSTYYYAYTVAQLFVGVLLDTYGVKKIGALSSAILSVGALLMLLMSPATLIIGRILIGFSASAAFLSYQRISSLNYDKVFQARLTSYALLVGNLSALLATYPLRVTLNVVGLRTTLASLAVLTFVIAAIIFAVSNDMGSSRGSGRVIGTVRHLKGLVRDPHIWGVSIGAAGVYGAVLSFQSAWGQKLMSDVFGLGADVSSQYLMVLALVFALTCPVTGFLSDKVLRRRKPLLQIATLASTASWALMLHSSLTSNKPLLITSIITLGLASGLHIVAPSMAKEGYDAGYSATAVAFFNVVLFSWAAVLQTVAPLIGSIPSIEMHLAISLIAVFTVWILTRETLD
jgi:MFS family permease